MKRSYNVRDFGAAGDGVTDDSDAIERAINAAAKQPTGDDPIPNSGAAVYFPEGTYLVSKRLEVKDRISIDFVGAGAHQNDIRTATGIPYGPRSSLVFNNPETEDPMLDFQSCVGFTISD